MLALSTDTYLVHDPKIENSSLAASSVDDVSVDKLYRINCKGWRVHNNSKHAP